MRALKTDPTRAVERRWASLAASLALHLVGLLLSAVVWPPLEPPPPPEVVELALVAQGRPDAKSPPAPERAPDRPATPAPAPDPRPAPRAPTGDRPPPAEPVPQPPQSFAAWQAQRRSRYLPARSQYPQGAIDGRAPIHRPGRRRCDPPEARNAERVYLLFDTSGSMEGIGRSQALTCAQQYAKRALDAGAEIVVGNFARTVRFAEPTRNMLDVQLALRALNDPTATRLPGRELQAYFQQVPDVPADLVIISDGLVMTEREVLIWYRFFLEMHPENRGIMYTVGNRGARNAVTQLRGLGFDVHAYEPTAGQ
ncbi:MAG: hypothetical protein AAGA48_36505 [Myxococcota bacterium]